MIPGDRGGGGVVREERVKHLRLPVFVSLLGTSRIVPTKEGHVCMFFPSK